MAIYVTQSVYMLNLIVLLILRVHDYLNSIWVPTFYTSVLYHFGGSNLHSANHRSQVSQLTFDAQAFSCTHSSVLFVKWIQRFKFMMSSLSVMLQKLRFLVGICFFLLIDNTWAFSQCKKVHFLCIFHAFRSSISVFAAVKMIMRWPLQVVEFFFCPVH